MILVNGYIGLLYRGEMMGFGGWGAEGRLQLLIVYVHMYELLLYYD